MALVGLSIDGTDLLWWGGLTDETYRVTGTLIGAVASGQNQFGVKGEVLRYVDESDDVREIEGVLDSTPAGATVRSCWVNGNELRWIDDDGGLRVFTAAGSELGPVTENLLPTFTVSAERTEVGAEPIETEITLVVPITDNTLTDGEVLEQETSDTENLIPDFAVSATRTEPGPVISNFSGVGNANETVDLDWTHNAAEHPGAELDFQNSPDGSTSWASAGTNVAASNEAHHHANPNISGGETWYRWRESGTVAWSDSINIPFPE